MVDGESLLEVFSERPRTTPLTEHHFELTDKNSVRVKQYLIQYAKRQDTLEAEIQNMLKAVATEPSVSEYNAPEVIAKKEDRSNIVCIDFIMTNFDSELMAKVDDIMAKLNLGDKVLLRSSFVKVIGKYQLLRTVKDLQHFQQTEKVTN